MRKIITLFLVSLMVLSVCAMPTYAATSLETILENYTAADDSLCYVETFDTEAAATGFGSWNKSNEKDTIGYDSVNKRLKVTRGQYDADTANQTFYHATTTSVTTVDSGLCFISFKAYVDSTIKYARYTLCDNSASNEQVRIQFDSQNQIRLYNGNTQYFSINAGEENTFAFLMNYNDHTFSFWLNKGSDLSTLTALNADAKDLAMASKTNSYSRFLCMYVNDKVKDYYGSMYLDDFKAIPLVAKPAEEPIPEAEGNFPSVGKLVYEEDFDDYEAGALATVAEGLVTSGVAAVNQDDMTIETDSANADNKYLVIDDTESAWHTWYFNKAANYVSPTKNIVIQFDFKSADNGYANLGSGTASNCILYYYNSSGVNFEPRINTPTTRGLDDFVTITFMIGEDNSLSMWIGDERVVHAYKSDSLSITSKVAGDLSKIDCINFRADGGDFKTLVDNIRVFEAADNDFLKVDKILRGVQEATDLSPVAADGFISDLSEDVVLNGVDASDKANYTVAFEDSKDYFDGNNMIFPLEADVSDITVSVSRGEIVDGKTFEDVTIPAAYSFAGIEWGEDVPAAGAKFDSAVVKADVRNQASDIDGRLLIVAALYSDGGQKLESVQIQNDTLVENGENAEGFVAILDLTDTTGLPGDYIVKVFVWESGTLKPIAGEYCKEF